MRTLRLLTLAVCLAGSAYCFSTPPPESGPAKPAAPAGSSVSKRVIQASSLRALVRSNRTVRLENAIIRGPLTLDYTTINEEVALINCEFEDAADFSYSTFKRHLLLQESTFDKGVNFEGTTIELNGKFDRLKVTSGSANFRNLHVQGFLSMRGAVFESQGDVIFAVARLDRGVDLENADFGGEAKMSGMQIGGDLDLQKVHFRKVAVLTTTSVAGSLFLKEAEFDDAALLPGIKTAYSAKIGGAVFHNRAGFSEIEINSFLDLSAAKFESPRHIAHFDKAHIVEGGFFENAQFAAGARFDSAHFNSEANFENSSFFDVTSFVRTHFDQAAHFEAAVFNKDVYFNETSFGSVDFTDSSAGTDRDAVQKNPFHAHVDLRGCTYGRIQIDWQSALRMPDGSPRLLGIDQQPYSELEKHLRDRGDDGAADRVSLEWRRIRRQQIFNDSKLNWLLDCASWTLTNYGVAPGRLLLLSTVLLVFGMMIFSLPGATSSDEGRAKGSAHTPLEKLDRLSHWDAFALSFHEFLPLDVPFGSRWSPGAKPVRLRVCCRSYALNLLNMRPSTCATLLKIGGYVLVPLQILLLNSVMGGGLRALGN